jgi:hypothetical protein
MKVFWIIMLLLALTATGLLLLRAGGGGGGGDAVNSGGNSGSAPASPPALRANAEPGTPVVPTPTFTDPNDDAAHVDDVDDISDVGDAIKDVTSDASIVAAQTITPGVRNDVAPAPADENVPLSNAFGDFVRTEHVESHIGTAKTMQSGAMTFEIPPTSAKILGGAGTKQNPYRITFDVLGLAYHTYRPSADLFELPELVTAIDGDWISLTGYHIYPAAMQRVEEMLLTKTIWDGCCIGIPPSPYDGVEIRLAEPIDPAILRSSPIATVQGRLRIDPYLHDNWLLSLYIIEESRIIPEL